MWFIKALTFIVSSLFIIYFTICIVYIVILAYIRRSNYDMIGRAIYGVGVLLLKITSTAIVCALVLRYL